MTGAVCDALYAKSLAEGRIKAKPNYILRQEFFAKYIPKILELGLTIPDPGLHFDTEANEWKYTEPDWNELRTVVTGHGPRSQERLEFRRLNRDDTRWVREQVLGVAPAVAA